MLNPDNPSLAKSYPISPAEVPEGLAITNGGIVYFCATDANGTGTPLFHKLDSTTGVITDLGTLQSTGGNDVYDRVLLSPDGSKLLWTSTRGDLRAAQLFLADFTPPKETKAKGQ